MMIDIEKFRNLVDSFYKQLLEVKDEISNIRLSEDKWSLRELVGHLIDSASNNHQRFVRLQLSSTLEFPEYKPEEWVLTQKYIKMDWDLLVSLWYGYNRLLLNVIKNADEAAFRNLWKMSKGPISLEDLIIDYYKHMEIHIEHFGNRVKELAI